MHLLLILLTAMTLVGCAAPRDEIAQRATTLVSAAPIYPPVARRYGVEGTARVRFCVLADGTVEGIQVEESSGSTHLDAAAVDAVKKSKYRPARTTLGKSVGSCATAPYRFVLEDSALPKEPAQTKDASTSLPAGQSSWADRVRVAIRKNIIATESIEGNPLAGVDVWLDMDGRILRRVLAIPSGSPAWDAAVLKALDRTERLPVDDNAKTPPRLRIAFRPKA